MQEYTRNPETGLLEPTSVVGIGSVGASETNEVEVSYPSIESISGEAETQSDINEENAQELIRLDERIDKVESSTQSSNAGVGELFAWLFDDTEPLKMPDYGLYNDGREISRTEYSALFAVIGTICGEGDGTTTFNLPDQRYVGRDVHWYTRYK